MQAWHHLKPLAKMLLYSNYNSLSLANCILCLLYDIELYYTTVRMPPGKCKQWSFYWHFFFFKSLHVLGIKTYFQFGSLDPCHDNDTNFAKIQVVSGFPICIEDGDSPPPPNMSQKNCCRYDYLPISICGQNILSACRFIWHNTMLCSSCVQCSP